jgi:hypothetical protein
MDKKMAESNIEGQMNKLARKTDKYIQNDIQQKTNREKESLEPDTFLGYTDQEIDESI